MRTTKGMDIPSHIIENWNQKKMEYLRQVSREVGPSTVAAILLFTAMRSGGDTGVVASSALKGYQ